MTVNERRRMHYGEGKIRVGEERGDLSVLCLVLRVLVHLLYGTMTVSVVAQP